MKLRHLVSALLLLLCWPLYSNAEVIGVPILNGQYTINIMTGQDAYQLQQIKNDPNATLHVIYDDSNKNIPLDFTFPYWGQGFTNSWMYSNGIISFTGANLPGGGCCAGQDLAFLSSTGQTTYNYSLMPLWTDLISNSNQSFYTLGTASSMTYGYYGVSEFGYANNLNSFEVKIDNTGKIDYKFARAYITAHQVTIGMTGDLSKGEYYQYKHGWGMDITNESLSTNMAGGYDICSVDPLSSVNCPGYQTAYLEYQCKANPLYSTTCSGYEAAYLEQQCIANPLYSTSCSGYQQAYTNLQCTLNPLYSTTCTGYQAALSLQQSTNNSTTSTNTASNTSASSTSGGDSSTSTTATATTTVSAGGLVTDTTSTTNSVQLDLGSATISTTGQVTASTGIPEVVNTQTVTATTSTAPTSSTTTTSVTTSTATTTTTTTTTTPVVASPVSARLRPNASLVALALSIANNAERRALDTAQTSRELSLSLAEGERQRSEEIALAPGGSGLGFRANAAEQTASLQTSTWKISNQSSVSDGDTDNRLSGVSAAQNIRVITNNTQAPQEEQQKTQTKEQRKHDQENDLAGGVNLATMAVVNPGFDIYRTMQMRDAVFYAPREIYRNQRSVDNQSALRQLSGASDRLHQQMIELQYK